MKDLKIAFTGGGSAGHVTPNLALIDAISAQGAHAVYFGRAESIEADLLSRVDHVPFCQIPSERLRRYFHWGNFVMPLYVLAGVWKSFWGMRRHRPQALFSKGGFVALPVVMGAWLNRIPVVIHESDGSLGLANRLSLPFARVVCLGQARALKRVKHRDVRHTGSPVRQAFLSPSPERAIEAFALHAQDPLLVVFGGSQGAMSVNRALRQALPELSEKYEIFHVCGRGGLVIEFSATDQEMSTDGTQHALTESYHQVEYIHEGFADLLSAAHIIIGRAGANGIAEMIAVKRPALLIPLPSASSRGDQLLNAEDFAEAGFGEMIRDEELTATRLIGALQNVEDHYNEYYVSLERQASSEGTSTLINVLKEVIEA